MTATLTVLGSWAIEDFGETTSFLVTTSDCNFLLDAGPGVTRQMHNLSRPLTDIHFVLLTHVHADHILGLPYVIFKRAVQERQLSAKIPKLRVIGNHSTIEAARNLLTSCYPDRPYDVDWQAIEDGSEFSISNLKIRTFAAEHTVPVTGYRIEGPDFSLAIVPDTVPLNGLGASVADVDLLLMEAFGTSADFLELAAKQKHLLALDAGKITAEANPRQVLLYHMHLPYRSETKRQELIDEFSRSCRITPVIASDLLEITF